jgi:hypothetical protein
MGEKVLTGQKALAAHPQQEVIRNNGGLISIWDVKGLLVRAPRLH